MYFYFSWNLTQKDITKLKIFQKILGGYFLLKHPVVLLIVVNKNCTDCFKDVNNKKNVAHFFGPLCSSRPGGKSESVKVWRFAVAPLTLVNNSCSTAICLGPPRWASTKTLRNINTIYHPHCPQIPLKHSQPPPRLCGISQTLKKVIKSN